MTRLAITAIVLIMSLFTTGFVLAAPRELKVHLAQSNNDSPYAFVRAKFEGLLVSGGQRLVIQDSGDLTGSVFVEQGVDLLKNRCIRFESFAGVKRSGKVECSGVSAFEEELSDEVLSLHQSDVVDQQATHPFALLVR